MGVGISWIAFQGRAKEQILAEANLRDSGEATDWYQAPALGVELPDGWYLVCLKGVEHPLASQESLENLSASCRIVSGMVEEHVMYSAASEYRRGRLVWRVSHQGDKDVFDLSAEGELPKEFEDVKREIWAQQEAENAGPAEVDHIFEIPLRVARGICGFKHDDADEDDDGLEFTRLIVPPAPSFLSRLFGR